uniref:Uncharacterized protein n=1 Tax=Timema poppense TaxID=170557 RepID=A0A7R9CJ99_TIMPO|nr:unnamed protein product [Timema poppensis]
MQKTPFAKRERGQSNAYVRQRMTGKIDGGRIAILKLLGLKAAIKMLNSSIPLEPGINFTTFPWLGLDFQIVAIHQRYLADFPGTTQDSGCEIHHTWDLYALPLSSCTDVIVEMVLQVILQHSAGAGVQQPCLLQ